MDLKRSSILLRIVKHELIVSAKVTSIIFAVQMIVQLLPLENHISLILTWTLSCLLLVVGFKSDRRFYSKSSDDAIVKTERLKCCLVLFVIIWTIAVSLFRTLDLPRDSLEDKDTVETVLRDIGSKLVLERVMDDGIIKGMIFLCLAHLVAVATFVNFARTIFFGFELLVFKIRRSSFIPVVKRKQKGKE